MKNYKLKKLGAMAVVLMIFSIGFYQFMEASSFKSSAASVVQPVGYVSYVVKSGDSLWTIAEDYMPESKDDVREFVHEIKQVNHLESDHIYGGQLIAVPCYSEEDALIRSASS